MARRWWWGIVGVALVTGCGTKPASQSSPPAPPFTEEDAARLNQAVAAFWVHEAAAGFADSPRAPSPQELRGDLLRGPGRLFPGDAEKSPERVRGLRQFAEARRPLADALAAVLEAGAWRALATGRPILGGERLPGPALFVRVHHAQMLAFAALVDERFDDWRSLHEGLLALGILVARGRPDDGVPERALGLRLGMEVQLGSLRAIQRADAGGWLPEGEPRQGARALLEKVQRFRIPWHRFENPSEVPPKGWVGGEVKGPNQAQGAEILHQVSAYREVLLEGLLAGLRLPRHQSPEGWGGPPPPDVMGGEGATLHFRGGDHEPFWIYSVGLDGRDDGGDHEADVVVYPLPADGRARRPVRGL